MSSSHNGIYSSKLQTVADLDRAAIELEENVTNLNKSFLRQLFKGFASITNALEMMEPGIFSTVIRWYRLYVRCQISIDPDNEKLLKQFEKTIPTAITYIIGCLQHKTKEIPNYHYSLLEIIEELLENVDPNIYKKIINLETGTIACLWNPIDYAGDFNTQLKALKVLSLLLKHFDNDKQNEELKSIKWTNLIVFQDKLKTIIEESKVVNVFNNTARELLNNFNMNFSENVLVYSFHCKTLILGKKFKFYKPLNIDKFWIDINYCPKSLSFSGRFKLNVESKYQLINVILKIKNISIENRNLIINYHKPGEFSKYAKEISAVSENFIQLTISQEEEQRLQKNRFVMDYFNKSNNMDSENLPPKKASDVFKTSYNLIIDSSPNKTVPEENKSINNNLTASDISTTKSISPDRKKRKFFISLLEEDAESEDERKKKSKKRSRKRQPRQQKPGKKQVCKVSPILDLTEIDDTPNKENVQNSNCSVTIPNKENAHKSNDPITYITNDLNDGVEKCIPSVDPLTSQQCSTILKNVCDIYNVGDTTYAEPCQSYRNFKTQRVSETVKHSFDAKPAKTRCNAKSFLNFTSDKENIDPNVLKSLKNVKGKRALSKNLCITSPNPCGTPINDEIAPTKKPRLPKDGTVYTTDIEIDLTADDPIILEPKKQNLKPKSNDKGTCRTNQLSKSSSYENILNDDLLEYEEVRSIDENPIGNPTAISTPNISHFYATPTSTMNISDINDSDMELTQITKKSKFKEKEVSQKKQQLNVVEQILNDWNINDDEVMQIAEDDRAGTVNNNDENNFLQKCVVFQKRLDEEESDNSDNDDIEDTHPSISFLKQPDFTVNEDFVVMQNMPLNLNTHHYDLDNMWNTPDKNNMIVRKVSTKSGFKYQETPNALILRQIEFSTKEAVLVKDMKRKPQSQYCRAKRSLDGFYNRHTNQQASTKDIYVKTANETVDKNNNTISSYGNPPRRTYLALKAKDKQIETSHSLIPSNRNYLNVANKNRSNNCNIIANVDKETAIVPYNKVINACLEMESTENNNYVTLKSKGNHNEFAKANGTKNLDSVKLKDKQPNVDNCEYTLKPSSTAKIISLPDNYNINKNINLENNFLQGNPISYDEPLNIADNSIIEIETFAEKFPSQYSNYSAENIENVYNNSNLFTEEDNLNNTNDGATSESENNQEFFEYELSQLLDDYNSRLKIRIENAQRSCLTNTTDLYVKKVREITDAVVRKSEEQKKELEMLHKNIDRLVTQIEWQYQIILKKSKLYDNFKEITERSLDALAELNVQRCITSEYQQLANQLKIDQNEVLQNVWQNFIKKRNIKYSKNIDDLSKI